MKEDIEEIGQNLPELYLMQWAVNNHRLILARGIFGGFFIKVMSAEDELVLTWPSAAHWGMIKCQLNYLCHRILNNDVDEIASKKTPKGLKTPHKYNGDEVERKLYFEDMMKWQNEIFKGVLEKFHDNHPYISELDEEKIVEGYNQCDQHAIVKMKKEWKEVDVKKMIKNKH